MHVIPGTDFYVTHVIKRQTGFVLLLIGRSGHPTFFANTKTTFIIQTSVVTAYVNLQINLINIRVKNTRVLQIALEQLGSPNIPLRRLSLNNSNPPRLLDPRDLYTDC